MSWQQPAAPGQGYPAGIPSRDTQQVYPTQQGYQPQGQPQPGYPTQQPVYAAPPGPMMNNTTIVNNTPAQGSG